jgi:hypothetical protein
MLVFLVLGGTAALVGGIGYFVLGGSWVAFGAGVWLVVAGAALGTVPLVAWAFRRFDVARDTPA